MARPPINSTNPITVITAAAGQTVLDFDFLIQTEGQLEIQLVRAATPTVIEVLVLGTDYTIDPDGVLNKDGGTAELDSVQFPTGAAAGDTFTCFRSIDIQRVTGFPNRGRVGAIQLNLEFDTVTLILQELKRDQDRAFTLPINDPLTSIEIPFDRANKFQAYDGSKNPIAAAGTSANLGPVSVYIDGLLPSADAAAARAYLVALQDVFTTRGDLVVQGALNEQRLALGNLGTQLISDSVDAVWGAPLGYIQPNALKLSRDAVGGDTDHDVNVTTGRAAADDGADMIVLAAEITKRIDGSWVVGDDAGGLDTGSVAPDRLYYIWLIKRSDTGVVDVLISLSATAPTMPTNYDTKRVIGFVRTDFNSNLLPFTWKEDGNYLWGPIDEGAASVATYLQAGLPSGVERIEGAVHLSNSSATTSPLIRVGPSGGVVVAGYTARNALVTGSILAFTTGFPFTNNTNFAAADLFYGDFYLTRYPDSANHWGFGSNGSEDGATQYYIANGKVSLSGELERFDLHVPSGDFDTLELSYRFFGHQNPRAL